MPRVRGGDERSIFVEFDNDVDARIDPVVRRAGQAHRFRGCRVHFARAHERTDVIVLYVFTQSHFLCFFYFLGLGGAMDD